VADARGQVHALTALTPIEAGREQRLREVLEGFPEGSASPLAQLASTHFARWVIVPQLVYGGRPQKPDTLLSQYLLFTTTFDGPEDSYLADMCARIPVEIDAVWGNCAGYEGCEPASRFAGYLGRHRIRTGLFVAAYPDATVSEVQEALELRERLIAFVTRADRMDDASLQAEFRTTFPRQAA
jgi:hypothetical protein